MEEDMKVSKMLMSLWINFAKYGDPTPPLNRDSNDEFYWAQSTSGTFPLYFKNDYFEFFVSCL